MEEDIKARSLNRRKKLLQNREERMRKIMYSFKEDVSQNVSPVTQFDQDFETSQPENDILNKFHHDTETKEGDQLHCDLSKIDRLSHSDDSNFESSALDESKAMFTNSFSKKKPKSSSVIIYSFLLTLAAKFDVIFPIVVLLLTALVGSYYQVNFIVPFVISQLVRVGLVDFKARFNFNLILILQRILNHWLIFTTLYVFINAIKYNQ